VLGIRRPPQGVHLKVTRPGYCRSFGATETVSARLVTSKHEVFLVNACLRAPGVASGERALRMMLRVCARVLIGSRRVTPDSPPAGRASARP
jgi:hypothetical protein